MDYLFKRQSKDSQNVQLIRWEEAPKTWKLIQLPDHRVYTSARMAAEKFTMFTNYCRIRVHMGMACYDFQDGKWAKMPWRLSEAFFCKKLEMVELIDSKTVKYCYENGHISSNDASELRSFLGIAADMNRKLTEEERDRIRPPLINSTQLKGSDWMELMQSPDTITVNRQQIVSYFPDEIYVRKLSVNEK